MPTDGPVIVGVDGSEQSIAALSWAVSAAELRQADVHVVVINDHPWRDSTARKVLDDITERCRRTHPTTRISERVVEGRPAAELIRLSYRAQLVVVGARGRGRGTGMTWGSVSTVIATRARCPVVVVPDEYRTRGPVFVGVDPSAHGHSVLEFAFNAAASRHTPLTALQTWEAPGAEHSVVLAPPEELQEAKSAAERRLGAQLTGWGEKYPNVALRRCTPRGNPVAALSEQAHNAQLLVLGHQRRRGLFANRLRSVTRRVLHRAQCPVAVITPDDATGATHHE